jgi:hypothetical protein
MVLGDARDRVSLLHENAPSEARERAAAQMIDQFLGKLERYFGLDEALLLPRIQERIVAARQLEQAVAQSKQSPSSGPPT